MIEDSNELSQAWGDFGLTAFQSENDSDRSNTVLIASKFDSLLARYMRVYFRHDDIIDDLLKGTGALASFDAKIGMAFALRIISDSEKQKLNYVRKIRNRFAHDANADFSAQPISQWAEELVADFAVRFDDTDHNSRTVLNDFQTSDLRVKFMLECGQLGLQLFHRLDALVQLARKEGFIRNIYEISREDLYK